GNYSYKVTYVTDNGETTASSASNTITTGGGNNRATVTIPTGPTGTNARYIYRTAVGGSTYYFLAQILNNTTTSYTDSIADASLATGWSPPTTNQGFLNTNNIAVTFSSVPGATSYRIYRGTTPGAETYYQTTSSSPFTDTGATG